MSVELSKVKTSSESKNLVNLVIGAAIIAVGVVLRAIVPSVGGITPNVVIGTYCLAVMLIVNGKKFSAGLASALGVGLVAAVLCTLISKSEIVGINFISEPIGALVGFLVFFAFNSVQQNKLKGQVISTVVGLALGVAVYLLFANHVFTVGTKPNIHPLILPLPITIVISLVVAILTKLALDVTSITPVVVAGLGTFASGFTYITIFKYLGHKPDALYYNVLIPVVLYTAIVNVILAQLLFGVVKAVQDRRKSTI